MLVIHTWLVWPIHLFALNKLMTRAFHCPGLNFFVLLIHSNYCIFSWFQGKRHTVCITITHAQEMLHHLPFVTWIPYSLFSVLFYLNRIFLEQIHVTHLHFLTHILCLCHNAIFFTFRHWYGRVLWFSSFFFFYLLLLSISIKKHRNSIKSVSFVPIFVCSIFLNKSYSVYEVLFRHYDDRV